MFLVWVKAGRDGTDIFHQPFQFSDPNIGRIPETQASFKDYIHGGGRLRACMLTAFSELLQLDPQRSLPMEQTAVPPGGRYGHQCKNQKKSGRKPSKDKQHRLPGFGKNHTKAPFIFSSLFDTKKEVPVLPERSR
jgi:hypothetical protein